MDSYTGRNDLDEGIEVGERNVAASSEEEDGTPNNEIGYLHGRIIIYRKGVRQHLRKVNKKPTVERKAKLQSQSIQIKLGHYQIWSSCMQGTVPK